MQVFLCPVCHSVQLIEQAVDVDMVTGYQAVPKKVGIDLTRVDMEDVGWRRMEQPMLICKACAPAVV